MKKGDIYSVVGVEQDASGVIVETDAGHVLGVIAAHDVEVGAKLPGGARVRRLVQGVPEGRDLPRPDPSALGQVLISWIDGPHIRGHIRIKANRLLIHLVGDAPVGKVPARPASAAPLCRPVRPSP